MLSNLSSARRIIARLVASEVHEGENGVHETQRRMVSQFAQETGAASLCAERTIAFPRGFGRKRFIGNAVKALSSSGSFNMRARAKIPSTAARKDSACELAE